MVKEKLQAHCLLGSKCGKCRVNYVAAHTCSTGPTDSSIGMSPQPSLLSLQLSQLLLQQGWYQHQYFLKIYAEEDQVSLRLEGMIDKLTLIFPEGCSVLLTCPHHRQLFFWTPCPTLSDIKITTK